VTKQTKTVSPSTPSLGFQIGERLASRELAEIKDLTELAGIIPNMSWDDYMTFRGEVKAGMIAKGYQEGGFDKFWSFKVLSGLKTLGVFPPVKPVTTSGSEKVKKSREKAKQAQNALEGKTEKQLIAMREELTPDIKAGKVDAVKKDVSIVIALNKLRKAQEKERNKGEENELKEMREALREAIKSAKRETLAAMMQAAGLSPAVKIPTSTLARKAA
jgi:hypothetical protein